MARQAGVSLEDLTAGLTCRCSDGLQEPTRADEISNGHHWQKQGTVTFDHLNLFSDEAVCNRCASSTLQVSGAQIQRLRRGKQLDRNDLLAVTDDFSGVPGSVPGHADVILLVRARWYRIDTVRVC